MSKKNNNLINGVLDENNVSFLSQNLSLYKENNVKVYQNNDNLLMEFSNVEHNFTNPKLAFNSELFDHESTIKLFNVNKKEDCLYIKEADIKKYITKEPNTHILSLDDIYIEIKIGDN